MSRWRWLLFVAIARFEVGEDLYLRIPNAKTIRQDVLVAVGPPRGGRRLIKLGRKAR